MNGLDQILSVIEDESRAQADAVRREAEEKAAARIAEVTGETQAEVDEILAAARKKAEQIVENAQNGAVAYQKRQRLAARADAITQSVQKAMAGFKTLDDDAYFALIERLIDRYAQPGAGELLLSGRDVARMPKDFLPRVNAALAAKNGSLTLGEPHDEIDGGCVLRYGETEENAAFDALLEDKQDVIRDRLVALLKA
ncbi:MAG: V-type ATP synthase subunit E [Acutalibacteraceae bacterium]|jgi:V/A-type H+-transporting ATPase subunit E